MNEENKTVDQEMNGLSEKKDSKKPKKEKKPWSKKKKIIFSSVCVVVAALIVWGGVSAYNILYKPQDLFETANPVSTPAPTEQAEEAVQEEVVEEDEGPSDYELLMQSADKDLMKDTLNILLIGVDYAEERETWNGKKDFHADVMMILAINFEENTVDMISIPRDTYAKIPGVDGIYKINASIDCGGGFPTEDGFKKVCETASWMLGGIPVDYYYAVTMPAVKQLVDAIGGVDFDLDVDFGIADRHYKKGFQHMDGQAVLDYLRIRKNAGKSYIRGGGTGDLNRVNRQKDMLVEIFNSLKSRDMLTKIPKLLEAFEGQLYTNTTTAQTAALALFAYDDLNSENIKMHSMDGPMKYGMFHWNFVATDQNKRVKIIKEVYGIDVKKYNKYSPSAAEADWQEMRNEKYVETAEKILKKANSILEADRLLATPSPSPSPSLPPTPTPTVTAPTVTTPPPTTTTPPPADPVPDPDPVPEPDPEDEQALLSFVGGEIRAAAKLTATGTVGGRKYSEVEDKLYETAYELYEKAKQEGKRGNCNKETNDSLQDALIKLAKALDIEIATDKKGGKDWVTPYWNTTNEIKVDFN